MGLRVVVVGGTKGIGRALTRRMAARGDRIHLLGRDEHELARCAADLQARMPASSAVSWSICDLEQPDTFAAAIDTAATALGGFDTAVITAGMFSTQPQLETDRELTRRLLNVNFVNTIL